MIQCVMWVDKTVLECKRWAVDVRTKCAQYGTRLIKLCTERAQEERERCVEERDEGYSRCKGYREEKTKKCQGWLPSWLGWVCVGWYWVVEKVCIGWEWVENIVCVAWETVKEWVCVAWAWVAIAVCTVFSYVVSITCVLLGWPVRLLCGFVNSVWCKLVRAFRWLFSSRVHVDTRVRHVFVLMLENRSYDHMLGFAQLDGIDAETGQPRSADGVIPLTHSNFDSDGVTEVFASTGAPLKITGNAGNEDPGHEFEHAVTQLAGAGTAWNPATGYPPINMSGFITTHRDRGSVDPPSIMKSFDPEDLPVLTTLAKEFAVCDRWFSSMPGPTWPNRFFAMAGSSAGLDDSPQDFDLVLSTLFDGFKFENGHIFHNLEKRCAKWQVFEGDELPVAFALSGMNYYAAIGRFTDMDEFASSVADPDFDKHFIWIEPHYGAYLPWTSGDYTCGTSQHPLDDVTRGEALIKDVYEAIRKSPHWEHSLLLITWDEHGGFYDHVAPPTATPPGDLPEPENVMHDFDFTQLGARVPTVLISPFIEKGTVDHTVYDHASIPALVEWAFKMNPMTARDAAASVPNVAMRRSEPRADCPVSLPDPADHVIECVDIFDLVQEKVTEFTQVLDDRVWASRRLADKADVPDEEPTLPPPLVQLVLVAARARLLGLSRWNVRGRIRVAEEIRALRTEQDARVWVLKCREDTRQANRRLRRRKPARYFASKEDAEAIRREARATP